MEKYLFFLTLVLIAFSCKKSENPQPEVEEPKVLIGITDNEDLTSFAIDEEIDLPDEDTTTLEIDIDGDSSIDLLFHYFFIASQTQLMLVEALNNLRIPRLEESFEYENSIYSYVNLSERGTELQEENFNWTGNQKLFLLYRNKNTRLSPYPSPLYDPSYLPILEDNNMGWVEFRILPDDSGVGIGSIRVDKYVFKMEVN